MYTITVTNGEAGDDEVSVDLMITVAGPPMTYEFSDPVMYIPEALGSSQKFTVMVMDANGNVPDFDHPDAMDAEIVVLGVEGSYVTGRGANNSASFDEETGIATFTIFAPVGATQGRTVLIQVRVDDEVVATHTVMFGEDPDPEPDMELGDAMNAMATVNDDGSVSLSWTAGANATRHWVAGARQNDDGTFDTSVTVWSMADSDSSHMVAAEDLASGNWVFTVIAGDADGWGSWATPFAEATVN